MTASADWTGTISLRLAMMGAAVAVATTAPAALAAQDRPSPLVLFSVYSAADGRPIEGALLEVQPLGSGTITDSLGRAVLRSVPPGTYRVSVEHLGFARGDVSVEVGSGEGTEFRLELRPRAIAVEPLTVEVTGRDPFLASAGFYDRQSQVETGYFGTIDEIESYSTFNTLFTFQRDLSVRFSQDAIVFINGLPAERRGYRNLADLRNLAFKSVRGVEAYPCNEAPDEMMRWLPPDADLTRCNLIVIWTG